MSGFFKALLKQRAETKKADPNVRGRFNEIFAILQKYDYDDGITPEIVVSILQDLGPTFVKIGPSKALDATASTPMRPSSRRTSSRVTKLATPPISTRSTTKNATASRPSSRTTLQTKYSSTASITPIPTQATY